MNHSCPPGSSSTDATKRIAATVHPDKRANIPTEELKAQAEKCKTARNLWVPAINNHGGFGRWAFLEITTPWGVVGTLQAFDTSSVATSINGR